MAYTDTGTTVKYGYAIAPSGGYDAAGNVKSVTDSVTGTWSYTYDPLNRLQTAFSATTNSSSQYGGKYGCWAYDPFGNRTAEYYQSSACPTPETSVPTTADKITYNTNNQVVSVSQAAPPTNLSGSFQYDPAGDVLNDVTNSYLYDAEGRLCAVKSLTAMTGYIYGADGTRVAKGTITSWSCNLATNGFALESSYVLGLGGEQVSEITGSGAWKHTNIFAGGKLIATYNGTGVPGTYFDLNDWLGTKRAEYGASNGCLSTFFSLPYGDGLPPSPSGTCPTDATEQHFTGKERDTESGNDYFDARYYASTMGRFMSPDWSAKVSPVPYATMGDPQSLNLYSYVRNNPLSRADADGHCDWCQKFANWARGDGFVTNMNLRATNETVRPHDTVSAAPATGNSTPQTASKPKGLTIGVGISGNVDVGVGVAGAEANGGYYKVASANTNGQVQVSDAASGGAVTYAGSHTAGAPDQSATSPLVAGAYAGVGLSGLIANTPTTGDLSGPFAVTQINIPLVSVQIFNDTSGDWGMSFTIGPSTPTASVFNMTTTTRVDCEIGCN
jgi:RHS repeat-associated protein